MIGWRRERRDLIREHQQTLERERDAWMKQLQSERASFDAERALWMQERRDLTERFALFLDRLAIATGRPAGPPPARRGDPPDEPEQLLTVGDPFSEFLLDGVR